VGKGKVPTLSTIEGQRTAINMAIERLATAEGLSKSARVNARRSLHAALAEVNAGRLATGSGAVQWLVGNAGRGNMVRRIASKLVGKGIRLGNCSRGVVEVLDGAGSMRRASRAGRNVVKALPAVGAAVSVFTGADAIAAAEEEDLLYIQTMTELGESVSTPLANHSLRVVLAKLAAQEVCGEIGSWAGLGLWGLGSIPCGMLGDYMGGAIAEGLLDPKPQPTAQELFMMSTPP
jgi:hypothetical protein